MPWTQPLCILSGCNLALTWLGLSRALFWVRLLKLETVSIPEERLSFAYGACISREVEQLASRVGEGNNRVVICGSPALSLAWSTYLTKRGVEAVVLDKSTQEAHYLAGLQALICMNRA